MNTEVKKLWIAALESGEYKKGECELKNGDKYCCLGVLCDIHAKTHGKNFTTEFYLGESMFLPKKVEKWAGLNAPNPTFKLDNVECNIADYNDAHSTFDEVIKIIKEQL